jgi:exosortase
MEDNARDSKATVLTTSDRGSISRLPPELIFSFLAAISLAIWWKALISTFSLALHDNQYTQILLILPVCAALIFMDWKSPETSTNTDLGIGSGFLVAATLIIVLARTQTIQLRPDEHLSVNMLALVVWWMGSFIFSFGTRAFRRAVFPLCFLLWIVPFPEFLLNLIISLLQEGSVASARVLLAAAGTPVAQEGTQLTIPGLTIEVARECSSIRSSLMLVVTTMILAQMLLRTTWRKAIVITLAIPLSIAKNGLRIFVLAMLATHVDRSFLTGRLHHQGGIIYFLIALAIICLLIWVGRRSEERRSVFRANKPLTTATRILRG